MSDTTNGNGETGPGTGVGGDVPDDREARGILAGGTPDEVNPGLFDQDNPGGDGLTAEAIDAARRRRQVDAGLDDLAPHEDLRPDFMQTGEVEVVEPPADGPATLKQAVVGIFGVFLGRNGDRDSAEGAPRTVTPEIAVPTEIVAAVGATPEIVDTGEQRIIGTADDAAETPGWIARVANRIAGRASETDNDAAAEQDTPEEGGSRMFDPARDLVDAGRARADQRAEARANGEASSNGVIDAGRARADARASERSDGTDADSVIQAGRDRADARRSGDDSGADDSSILKGVIDAGKDRAKARANGSAATDNSEATSTGDVKSEETTDDGRDGSVIAAGVANARAKQAEREAAKAAEAGVDDVETADQPERRTFRQFVRDFFDDGRTDTEAPRAAQDSAEGRLDDIMANRAPAPSWPPTPRVEAADVPDAAATATPAGSERDSVTEAEVQALREDVARLVREAQANQRQTREQIGRVQARLDDADRVDDEYVKQAMENIARVADSPDIEARIRKAIENGAIDYATIAAELKDALADAMEGKVRVGEVERQVHIGTLRDAVYKDFVKSLKSGEAEFNDDFKVAVEGTSPEDAVTLFKEGIKEDLEAGLITQAEADKQNAALDNLTPEEVKAAALSGYEKVVTEIEAFARQVAAEERFLNELKSEVDRVVDGKKGRRAKRALKKHIKGLEQSLESGNAVDVDLVKAQIEAMNDALANQNGVVSRTFVSGWNKAKGFFKRSDGSEASETAERSDVKTLTLAEAMDELENVAKEQNQILVNSEGRKLFSVFTDRKAARELAKRFGELQAHAQALYETQMLEVGRSTEEQRKSAMNGAILSTFDRHFDMFVQLKNAKLENKSFLDRIKNAPQAIANLLVNTSATKKGLLGVSVGAATAVGTIFGAGVVLVPAAMIWGAAYKLAKVTSVRGVREDGSEMNGWEKLVAVRASVTEDTGRMRNFFAGRTIKKLEADAERYFASRNAAVGALTGENPQQNVEQLALDARTAALKRFGGSLLKSAAVTGISFGVAKYGVDFLQDRFDFPSALNFLDDNNKSGGNNPADDNQNGGGRGGDLDQDAGGGGNTETGFTPEQQEIIDDIRNAGSPAQREALVDQLPNIQDLPPAQGRELFDAIYDNANPDERAALGHFLWEVENNPDLDLNAIVQESTATTEARSALVEQVINQTGTEDAAFEFGVNEAMMGSGRSIEEMSEHIASQISAHDVDYVSTIHDSVNQVPNPAASAEDLFNYEAAYADALYNANVGRDAFEQYLNQLQLSGNEELRTQILANPERFFTDSEARQWFEEWVANRRFALAG